MKAIVIGATGATGKDLLELLISDSRVTAVRSFVRRPRGHVHPKLEEFVINFDQPEMWQSLVQGDVLYCCLGTTRKAAGSKALQYKVDYGYPLAFAEAAHANGAGTFVLVSSAGANAGSPFFYMKTKGQLEEAVKAVGFRRTLIFRPPSLIRRETDRTGEKWSVKALQILNRVGIAKALQPVTTYLLARQMVAYTFSAGHGIHYYSGPEIREQGGSQL